MMSCYTIDGSVDHPLQVYAYLDAEGRYLYIGQTCHMPTRHGAHRQKAPWFADAVGGPIVLSEHLFRTDARRAEAAVIREHRPLHNVFHNPDAMKKRAAA